MTSSPSDIDRTTAICIWPFEKAPNSFKNLYEDEADWVVMVPAKLMDGTAYEDTMPPEWLSGEYSPLGFYIGEDELEDGSVVSYWGRE